MNSYEYLQEVKKINNLDTDYKVCKLMNWPTNRATMYKNGQSMDNEAARQVAEILNVPLMKIIADMEIQRAKDEPTRKAWKMLAKMTKQSGKATTNLLILLGVFTNSTAVLCILCKIANVRMKPISKVSTSLLKLA